MCFFIVDMTVFALFHDKYFLSFCAVLPSICLNSNRVSFALNAVGLSAVSPRPAALKREYPCLRAATFFGNFRLQHYYSMVKNGLGILISNSN